MPLIHYKVDDKANYYKDGYKIVGHRKVKFYTEKMITQYQQRQ